MSFLWHTLRHHLWWILSSLALIGGMVVVQNTTTIPQTLSAPLATATPIYYQPLINLSSPDYKPLIAFNPLLAPTNTPTARPLNLPAPTASPTPTATPPPNYITHIVRPGEVLVSIALEHGITAEAILLANQLHSTASLAVGQKLLIPEKPHAHELYEVKRGDTILSVAARFGSSVEAITKANPQFTLKTIQVGDQVKIPTIFSLEPTPQTASSAIEQYYEVQPGDAILTIADEFNVSAELLLAINNITNPQQLRVGTKLLIPSNDGLMLGVPIVLYQVKANETLLSIVSKYGSSVRDVLYTNPSLLPAALKKGDLVAVPIIFPTLRTKPSSSQPTRQGPPPLNQPQLVAQMIAALNAEREQNHLPPLLEDETLKSVALGHAQDMVMRDFFGHVNPDGQTLRQRLIAGKFGNPYHVGENIQRNNQPSDKTVQVALNWLMNSKLHRQNMLNADYHLVGVSLVQSGEMYTIVMDFSE